MPCFISQVLLYQVDGPAARAAVHRYYPTQPPRIPDRPSSSATSLGGATTRYASSTISRTSFQSTGMSRYTPSQPRCPTYGGRKNRPPAAPTNPSPPPGGAPRQN